MYSIKEKILKLRGIISSLSKNVSDKFNHTELSFNDMKELASLSESNIDTVKLTTIPLPDSNKRIGFLCENLGEDMFIGNHKHPDCWEYLSPINESLYDFADRDNPTLYEAGQCYTIAPGTSHNIFVPTGAKFTVFFTRYSLEQQNVDDQLETE